MRILISLILVLASQLSFAESLDLRNLQIKVIDQEGKPAGFIRAKFDVEYSVMIHHIACYFPSAVYDGSPGPCPFPKQGKSFNLITSTQGLITFDDHRRNYINPFRAVNPSVIVTFETREVPKCLGLNYFPRSPTAPGAEYLSLYVFDRTIRISNHTLQTLKGQNTKQIVCQLQ